ncbi:MAG: glycosyltransferase family 4 protein [Bacteroidetes bacterium]|nr:glycosyltransferase family 4 protein [Bacteroidota bacterium]
MTANNKIKIKVVWLCWFSNADMNALFGKNLNEVSPWISNLIKIFESRDDIEIHVVSPNRYTNKNKLFMLNNIYYHFYKTYYLVNKKIYSKLHINEISNYRLIRSNIKRIIDNINPDLVHLHGAENPIYSIGILSIVKKYIILVTIQGFINLETIYDNKTIRYRKKIEKEILSKCNNYGVRSNDTCKVIKMYNESPNYFWHDYPITKPNQDIIPKNKEYSYDCAFFARISPENGIEDLFKAIKIVKESKPDITLVVIGPVEMVLSELKNQCIDIGIEDNVIFKGYYDSQQEAFQEVSKAKIDVLPTHYDVIPGTILECMYIGVPVISYSVGGIPELNEKRESVALVEKGNVEKLANKILGLLTNETLRQQYIKNGKITAESLFDYNKIYDDLHKIYNTLTE